MTQIINDSLISSYLDQLLSVHWLRPETALWRVFDCLLMHDTVLKGRTADLGCGDGTLSYIMAGGKVGDLDNYSRVASLSTFNKGTDIYNAEVDDSDGLLLDNSSLRYGYSFGLDHKAGLISKAQRFSGFYGKNVIHDLNVALPFEDGDLDAAFSNILYWLNDIDGVLKDWNRALTRQGKLVLFLPNDTFKEKAWFYYLAPHKDGRRYYNYFDRGYSDLIKHCYTHAVWQDHFTRNGFRIVRHEKYLTDPVMEIWNIGTRPLSPLLISMAGHLSPKGRPVVKDEWVRYFKSFFHPIVAGEFGRASQEGEYAFHFYVLEKT
jgi:SAM-dependent methyltransferase